MSITKEFKEFAVKGNVIDLAVGVIIGAAFGKIVDSVVGGGILVHGVPALHHAIDGLGLAAAAWPLGGLWSLLTTNLLNAVVGLAAGAAVLSAWLLLGRLRGSAVAH